MLNLTLAEPDELYQEEFHNTILLMDIESEYNVNQMRKTLDKKPENFCAGVLLCRKC